MFAGKGGKVSDGAELLVFLHRLRTAIVKAVIKQAQNFNIFRRRLFKQLQRLFSSLSATHNGNAFAELAATLGRCGPDLCDEAGCEEIDGGGDAPEANPLWLQLQWREF